MKICFVSYEIAPTTPGGAGSFVANAIQTLLEVNPDDEIILLLDIPVEEFVRFEWHDKLAFPNCQRIRAYCVDELCWDIPINNHKNFSPYQLWKSYRFNHALQKVIQIENPDLVEFFDYSGSAYVALSRRIGDEDVDRTAYSIRFHTTILPIHKANSTLPDLNSLLTYGMEARALELIERILFPSKVIQDDILKNYQISAKTDLCISPPPLKRYPQIKRFFQKTAILFLGYLTYMKGADLFLSAALLFLSRHLMDRVDFILVGGDFYEAPSGFSSFREYLESRIPPAYSDRFIITGQISHKRLGDLLEKVRFAVIPSFVESFSYAAHELYAAGIPIIVRNIPVFTQYFKHEENALVFDGSVEDLTAQMERLWEDEELLRKITKPYEVLPPPLGDCYKSLPVQNRSLQTAKPVNLSLKILILADKLRDFSSPPFDNCLVWQLVRVPDENNPPFPFLGDLWWIYDSLGNPVSVEEWRCSDLMMVVTESDSIDEEFILEGRRVLEQNPEISYVACWKELNGALKIYPTDAASETLLFEEAAPARILYRTPRNKHFFDVFDNRMGVFAEIGYIWKLEEETGKGITIPEVLLRANDNAWIKESFRLDSAEFNFLFMNSSLQRQAKLGHYFFTINSSLSKKGIEEIAQENSRLRLAELDLKLLLKKLSTPPFGWIFRLRKNFRILLKRYLEGE
ncbi:MAG: hypothetical protein KatS3mg045_1489 [Bellilinea sp.]|nr:MAG: hypothetical protein KatS3mg045_1489 [Bellilinea sp.]